MSGEKNFDDDFLKELDEASNVLKKEFLKEQKEEKVTNKPEVNSGPTAGSHGFNQSEMENDILRKIEFNSEFQNLLGSLMKNVDMGQNNGDLDKLDQNQLFQQLNSQISEIEKKMSQIENQKTGTSTNNQQPEQSNPFINAFKEISEEKDMKDIKNIFEGLGIGNEFNDLFNNPNNPSTQKNAGDLMNILNQINENDSNTSGPELSMNGIFEQLFEVLLKEDVLTKPLSTIKTRLEKYIIDHPQLPEEEKKKYVEINGFIDNILNELKKEKPNKELVLNIFEKLHTIGELPEEIMNDTQENMDMFNMAQNLFKK